MTTTGTRAASRSMMGEATKPSPMRIPSTLPDSESSREKSGRSPCMKVISSDQLRCLMQRLDAAQHLVVVQQAHVLDVEVLELALHAHQADHVLAAAGQALRRAVGDVTELLDGLLDPEPGGLADPILAVDDPRDGRRRHARQARHVVEGYHFFPISDIAVIPLLTGM